LASALVTYAHDQGYIAENIAAGLNSWMDVMITALALFNRYDESVAWCDGFGRLYRTSLSLPGICMDVIPID